MKESCKFHLEVYGDIKLCNYVQLFYTCISESHIVIYLQLWGLPGWVFKCTI